METVNFVLLGLGNGAVYAALALALVVTYRGSATVNFAAGSIALYAAYTYAYLRDGRLLIPIPGLPGSIGLADSLPFVPAALLALASTALLGGLIHLLVFKHLRTATPVTRAVASVGVMLTIQSVLALRLGTDARPVGAFFPATAYEIGGLRVAGGRLWTMIAIVGISVVVGVLYHRTRFGLATTAVAETEVGATVSGVSVDRVAAVNWMLSSAIAGAGGILVAPIVPLVPVAYTLFIVPAVAAALAARFTRMAVAVGVAAAIGLAQSGLLKMTSSVSWLSDVPLAELVPLVLIIGVLLLHGSQLPIRGTLSRRVVGTAPRPERIALPTAAWCAIAVVLLFVLEGSYRAALIQSLIVAVIMLSFVVVTGFLGQMSLAQMALAGVGAFSVSTLSSRWGVPFPLAPLLAAGIAALIGVVVGLPSLRVRGYSVAIATIALAAALDTVWFRNNSLNGGASGARPSTPWFFGLDLGVGQGRAYPRIAFGIVAVVVLVGAGIGVALLRRSRLGEAMLAVSTNERSAAASGIRVARTKLAGFVIGAALAGLGGAMLAYHTTTVSADSYAPLVGVTAFATAYLAGVTTITGAVIGGVFAQGGILWLFAEHELGAGRWFPLIGGVGLVITMLAHPDGIGGDVHRLVAKLRRHTTTPTPTRHDGATSAPILAGAPAQGAPVLRLHGVGVRYGSVTAVHDVDMQFDGGQIAGIIGPNGAGKSTLVDAITGFVGGTGRVEFLDRDLGRSKPAERARFGLIRTFQSIELYDGMTVRENVAVGAIAQRGRHTTGAVDESEVVERVAALLELDDIDGAPVSSLPHGHRQLVAIARALAGLPSLLLLDEPAAGLDRTEVRWLADRLRAIRDAGVTVVLIDHDIDFVLGLCDIVHVLDLGELIVSGTPDEVKSHPRVIDAYLGISHEIDEEVKELKLVGHER